MKRMIIKICVLGFAVLLTASLNAQKSDLIFSHKYHAEEVGAACSDCHASVIGSESSSDNLLPAADACLECHDAESSEDALYQVDLDKALEKLQIVSYIAKFSHKRHIDEGKECATCHQGVEKSTDVGTHHMPKMGDCLSCHENTGSDEFCSTCHAKDEDLLPNDHRLAWLSSHGIGAELAKTSCMSCHTQSSCDTCHESDNLDRKVHRLNFVNSHGISAKGNKETCLTCHEEQQFCMDCHRTRMVMPRSHSVAAWSNTTTGGSHARAARMDLDSCLGCHSDAASDPVCTICHQ